MQFVHKLGGKERSVEFTAALDQQPSHFPLFTEPAQSRVPVKSIPTTDNHFIGQAAKPLQASDAGAFSCQDNDW